MGFSIKNDYSILNIYDYKNKSLDMKVLDFLSKPCRRILGGRDVHVASQTYRRHSKGCRIGTLFLMVIVAPFGLTSLACLGLKAATKPSRWEKKIVQRQSDKAIEIQNQFRKAFQENQPDEALKIYQANTSIARRNDITADLKTITEQKVDSNNFTWKELQTLISTLRTYGERIAIIDRAIAIRLDHASTSKPQIGENQIINFIAQACPNSLNANVACYKHLLENSLKLKPDDSPQVIVAKMALADQIKNTVTRLRIQYGWTTPL